MAPEPGTPRRPSPLGVRGAVLVVLLAAGGAAFVVLDLSPLDLVPSEGGLEIAGRFFAGAVSPALDYEAEFVPKGAPPFLLDALGAVWTTLLVAGAAMGLSLVIGAFLGFLASTAWWAGESAGASNRILAFLRRSVAPVLYVSVRVLIAFMRSVHELLWAVLFLAALGLNEVTAVIAIAIPYGGTLAKVFSEMVDEAPRDTADALRGAGASPLQVYFVGLVPRALPDLTAYAFYRFECAIRSAAIMGFFGISTLGAYIKASFEGTNYGEVWTYLYLTFLVVLVMDLWSGAIRRRVVA
jgi:phosphonate transport system permease protein